MQQKPTLSTRIARWRTQRLAKRAAVSDVPAGFVSQPEPRTIGRFARGKQLVAGNLQFAGHVLTLEGNTPWDLDAPNQGFEDALHGFRWLNDLGAVGDRAARNVAQEWVFDWIARFGDGAGPGWSANLVGRRLIRWINHAILLLSTRPPEDQDAFFATLARQVVFLERTWPQAEPGLARFEALTGLIYASRSLIGMEEHAAAGIAGLEQECATHVSDDGGIATRNPEELLEVFTLLDWTAQALRETGMQPGADHRAALERIAPTLRALRHADGGLARFHGGGRGIEGRLDRALADAGLRAGRASGLAMGFARLSGGRTSLVLDGAVPPTGAASGAAHASTLALEITSGRQPLIVNCGSGAEFGEDWEQAGRATPSHSVLGLNGVSSARLGPEVLTPAGPRRLFKSAPERVVTQLVSGEGASGIDARHDGYRAYGLTLARRVELAQDGKLVTGEETLTAPHPQDQALFTAAIGKTGLDGIGYALRFHLHPDVDASIDLGGSAVSLVMRSGEIWVLRYEGPVKIALEPSVFLEKGRLKPRATKQVVLSGAAMDYATRIRWSLTMAQEAPKRGRARWEEDAAGH